MRQKAVALLMAALLIAAVPLSAGANVNPFSDVRADHWAYDAIVKLAAAGLIEGIPTARSAATARSPGTRWPWSSRVPSRGSRS
jgi:S-layer homology domain.